MRAGGDIDDGRKLQALAINVCENGAGVLGLNAGELLGETLALRIERGDTVDNVHLIAVVERRVERCGYEREADAKGPRGGMLL